MWNFQRIILNADEARAILKAGEFLNLYFYAGENALGFKEA